jgi:hypothetical protein
MIREIVLLIQIAFSSAMVYSLWYNPSMIQPWLVVKSKEISAYLVAFFVYNISLSIYALKDSKIAKVVIRSQLTFYGLSTIVPVLVPSEIRSEEAKQAKMLVGFGFAFLSLIGSLASGSGSEGKKVKRE